MSARLALALVLLAAILAPASAQLSTTQSEPRAELPEAPAPLEDLEADRAWIQHRLDAATTGLTEAQAAQARAGESRDGKEVELLSGMVMVQNFRILALRQHLELLSEVEVMRQELAQLRQDEDAVPVSRADTAITYASALRHWLDLGQFREEEEAEKLRTALFAKGKQQSKDLLSGAAQDYRLALEKLEGATEDSARRLAREEVTLDRAAQEFAQERLAYFSARERAQEERAARNQIRERLLSDAMEQSVRGLKLGDGEVSERLEAIARELSDVQSALASLTDEESTLHTALEQARAAATLANGDPANSLARDDELRRLMDRATTLRATADDLATIYVVWMNFEQSWWQQRHQLERTPVAETVRALPRTIATNLENAEAALRLIALTQSEVARHIEDLPPAGTPQNPATDALRASLTHRADLLQGASQAIHRASDFLKIWQTQLQIEHQEISLVRKGRAWIAGTEDTVRRLWNYELIAMEDRITIDGEVLVEKRPVTLGKAILAIIVLSVGLVVARWVGRFSGLLLAPLYRRNRGNRLIIEKLIRAATILLAVVIALITVKIPLAVFAFLGGALAIGVGFGAQNLINNFISGFILLAERPIRQGDIIELDGTRGKVEMIGERCTRVRRFDGIEILIPNSQLLEQSVTNMTHSDHRMRASLKVGVAYGSPTRKVQDILLRIARDHELVLNEPAPQALFESLGDSTLNFSLYFWVDLFALPDWRAVASDLLHRVCERMAEENIEIAFPQRDVHLHAHGPLPVALTHPADTRDGKT